MKDYSGFYYNVQGIYEDLIYYISPMPEQKLYMIKKYNPVVDTNKILKSIETGFNGYDYESNSHFSGSVNGGMVNIFDYQQGKYFNFGVWKYLREY